MEGPGEPTTDRLEAFSDGIFAVAATLLVLNLTSLNAPHGHLASVLASKWPLYATYVVSFITIGIVWLNHHAQFRHVASADRTLMVINLLLLMFVTLTPFPTSLLASHLNSGADEHVAAVLYAATLFAMGVSFFASYLWCARRHLFEGWIDERHVSYLIRRNMLGLFIYAAAIGVAFVNAPTSLGLCGLVAIYYLLPARAPAASARV
ncbi:MAG TPA: TMEM175 family protein [Solirubrobacteraceae bacterium]